MDREWGSKPGSGGAASAQNEAIDRRERLRRLALETIDLAKDPYFMRNHLGSYECKLCLTLHNNEGNYLAHTQGKRHQTNLAKRAAREAKEAPIQPQPNKRKVAPRKTVKIGRPGYRVTKQYDPDTKQRSLLFQIEYPEIEDLAKPRIRYMSSFEQRVYAYDKLHQFILFAAEPYEIIGFRIPSNEIDNVSPKSFTHWDPDSKMYTVQLYFRPRPMGQPPQAVNGPLPPQPPTAPPPARPPPPQGSVLPPPPGPALTAANGPPSLPLASTNGSQLPPPPAPPIPVPPMSTSFVPPPPQFARPLPPPPPPPPRGFSLQPPQFPSPHLPNAMQQ
ncbi:hypothetical protein GOP47_0017923 [Adiantum capillus-veneris]|uniref:Matrin-type domain-containing protein n=1 Tax=Adiantum capillus-veneris TaxID=13818 RepID=A0A9D4UGI8_ADICA|nr:hypothetical protein GOP47_0017923 [Adiantum capillus-veneris]